MSGGCGCAPGFTGYYCIDPCPEGTWGPQCRNKCHCRKGACHHVTGDCVCPGGWTGASCEVPCADGSYGPDCEHRAQDAQLEGRIFSFHATDGFFLTLLGVPPCDNTFEVKVPSSIMGTYCEDTISSWIPILDNTRAEFWSQV